METKLYSEIADYFNVTMDQLVSQDMDLLLKLFKEWKADEFDKVHQLGYQIVR